MAMTGVYYGVDSIDFNGYVSATIAKGSQIQIGNQAF